MAHPDVQKDEIICQCHQILESTIRSTIEAGDLQTIEEITAASEAGGGCQSCHILLQLFIDQSQHKGRPIENLVADHAMKVQKRGIFSKLFARF